VLNGDCRLCKIRSAKQSRATRLDDVGALLLCDRGDGFAGLDDFTGAGVEPVKRKARINHFQSGGLLALPLGWRRPHDREQSFDAE
jgi:hypothetical protein